LAEQLALRFVFGGHVDEFEMHLKELGPSQKSHVAAVEATHEGQVEYWRHGKVRPAHAVLAIPLFIPQSEVDIEQNAFC